MQVVPTSTAKVDRIMDFLEEQVLVGSPWDLGPDDSSRVTIFPLGCIFGIPQDA